MKKIVLLLLLLGSFTSIAQNNPQDELGAWYMYGGTHKLSSKWYVKSLAHFRFFNIGDDLQQVLLRAGVNYKTSNSTSILLGYAYLNTDTTFGLDGGEFNEHRIYEDFYFGHKVSKLTFAHRFRLEHRFFETNTQHWIRYQLALSYPLSKNWSTYLYDEVFLNFEGDTYAQNWLGAGFKYKLSKALKLQLGYQQISVNGGAKFNRIQLGIALTTNHQKK